MSYSVLFVSWWLGLYIECAVCTIAVILVAAYCDPIYNAISLPLFIAFWGVVYFSHTFSSRIVIRATGFDFCSAHQPSTIDDLLQTVKKFHPQKLEMIGSGWSFWLKRRYAASPHIFTHRLRGRHRPNDSGDFTYLSGTPLCDVLDDLRKRGKTLASAPAIDDISLGGWVASGSHGSAGPGAKHMVSPPTHSKFVELGVVDVNGDATRIKPNSYQGQIVLWVKLRTVDNIDIQKEARPMSDTNAEWWLRDDAVQRMLFVNGHDAFLLKWVIHRPLMHSDHRDPHCCSRECGWFQADVLGAMCKGACLKWFGRHALRTWKGVSTLDYAIRFVPRLTPVSALISVLVANVNFELFFMINPRSLLNGQHSLSNLVKVLQKYHSVYGGRSEIRHGGSRDEETLDSYPLMLDVGIVGERNVATYIACLKRYTLWIKNVSVHMGKMDVTNSLVQLGYTVVPRHADGRHDV